MTKNEIKIIKAILYVLHEVEGGQLHELPLHAEVCLLRECSLAEFAAALKICDTHRWVIGIHSKFRGRLWSISDAGEAAALEM
jgi:hypothetical protein